jgi:hypothetical protein
MLSSLSDERFTRASVSVPCGFEESVPHAFRFVPTHFERRYFTPLVVVNGDDKAMVSAMVVQLEPAAEIVWSMPCENPVSKYG